MLKTISAALLAASVIAAPALAAQTSKTTQPSKTTGQAMKADQTQTKASTTAVKPGIKSNTKAKARTNRAHAQAKPLNANASLTRRHNSARLLRPHHKMVKVIRPSRSAPGY